MDFINEVSDHNVQNEGSHNYDTSRDIMQASNKKTLSTPTFWAVFQIFDSNPLILNSSFYTPFLFRIDLTAILQLYDTINLFFKQLE